MRLKEQFVKHLNYYDKDEKIVVNYAFPDEDLEIDYYSSKEDALADFQECMDMDVEYITFLTDREDVVAASYHVDQYPGTGELYTALSYRYDEEHMYDDTRELILDSESNKPVSIIYIKFSDTCHFKKLIENLEDQISDVDNTDWAYDQIAETGWLDYFDSYGYNCDKEDLEILCRDIDIKCYEIALTYVEEYAASVDLPNNADDDYIANEAESLKNTIIAKAQQEIINQDLVNEMTMEIVVPAIKEHLLNGYIDYLSDTAVDEYIETKLQEILPDDTDKDDFDSHMDSIRDIFLDAALTECESYIDSLSDMELADYDTNDTYPAEEDILDTAWEECDFVF